MRYLTKISFIILVTFYSCSSDDDGASTIDQALLVATWTEVGKCETQNNLRFNQNGTYVWLQSANVDCQTNERPTFEISGNYDLLGGNEIRLNEDTIEIIDEGTEPSVTDSGIGYTLIYQKIINLTETSLTIEEKGT